MATTTVNYAADEAITVTTWQSLATDSWATSSAFDNTTNKYVDVLIGGAMALDTVTGTIAAGETCEIYVCARYDNDLVSYTGGIGTTLGASDSTLTEDTEFTPLNLILAAVVAVEDTAPDVDQDYNWGPVSVASLFGGVVPQNFILLLHNGTGATTGSSGMVVNAVGIKYDSV